MQNKPHKDRALPAGPADLPVPAPSAAPHAPEHSPAASPITPAQIVAAARTHLGAPFRHQGRSAQGLDCVGLLVLVARALGQPHHDVTGYTRRATGMGFLRHFRDHLDEIAPANALEGDVLVFVESVYPCHTGILSQKDGCAQIMRCCARRRGRATGPAQNTERDILKSNLAKRRCVPQ